jgi:disease resistance protein RPS2
LQDQIAEGIHLQLPSIANSTTRIAKLCASLKNKKFLLILDNVWSTCPLDLQKYLRVGFGVGKGRKVVFSTHSRDITLMREQQSIQVEPLLQQEGRIFFNILFFQDDHVPKELMGCARETADECRGLPLARTVVAATMRGKTDVEEWNLSLSLMKIADPSFPNTHPRIDRDLYQILRGSYKDLPRGDPNLQHCFLYCHVIK